MRGHADLRAAVALSVLCALAALILPFSAVRLVFAAPLTLFLPGYAIAAAAFARRPLDRPRLLLLSLGLSLATLAPGALVLNYLPGGIRAGTWALLLVLVVLGACRAAALSRPKATATGIAWPRLSPSRTEAGLLAAGALAALAAIVLVFVPFSAKHAIGYTEMWIQPLDGRGAAGVRIGVGNREQDDASYRLLVHFGRGKERATASRDFALDSGQTQVLEVPSATPPAGEPLPVVAALYLAGSPDAYRRVSAWIPSAEGPG